MADLLGLERSAWDKFNVFTMESFAGIVGRNFIEHINNISYKHVILRWCHSSKDLFIQQQMSSP